MKKIILGSIALGLGLGLVGCGGHTAAPAAHHKAKVTVKAPANTNPTTPTPLPASLVTQTTGLGVSITPSTAQVLVTRAQATSTAETVFNPGPSAKVSAYLVQTKEIGSKNPGVGTRVVWLVTYNNAHVTNVSGVSSFPTWDIFINPSTGKILQTDAH